MLARLRLRRPSHATVVAYLALFVALGGTSAVALNGSNTVFSDDIANDNFNSPTEGQGGLVASDLRAGSVTSSEVADGSLTGADVFNNTISGADITNGSLTGADVFDNTIGGADVTNDSLSSIDIASGGVSSAEIAPFSINEGDIASNVIDTRHINNGTLNDEDVGQGTFVDFAASIGTIPPESCVYRNVTGINAQGDHLLLTPSFHDSQDAVYSLQYHTDAEHATLQACNPGPFSVNDGITHFNLLVIDAQ